MAWRGTAGSAGGAPVDNAVVTSGTFSSNPVAGDLIAWWIIGEPDSGTLNNDAITDSAGNTGYSSSSLLGTGGRKMKLYYKENASTTSGLTGTATNPNLILGHTILGACAAVATSSALDEVAVSEQSAPGTGTNAITVTSAATDSAGQHIFAASGNNAPIDTFSAGTGGAIAYTKGNSTYPTSSCSETGVQASAGTATATFTVDDGSGNFITGVATFRAAASAVDKTGTDSGTGTEGTNPTVAVAIAAPVDAVTGTERTLPISASLGQADTCAGTDRGSCAATATVGDSGTATEGASVDTGSIAKSDADAATATEAMVLLVADVVPRDAGTLTYGVPNIAPWVPETTPLVGTDSATATESATVTVGDLKSGADSGSTDESTTELWIDDPSIDITATDRLVTMTAAVGQTDTGALGETPAINASVTAARDTGTATEGATVTQTGTNPVDSDSATAADQAAIEALLSSLADSASGVESALVTVEYVASDAGTAGEHGFLSSASWFLSDGGVATEAATLVGPTTYSGIALAMPYIIPRLGGEFASASLVQGE